MDLLKEPPKKKSFIDSPSIGFPMGIFLKKKTSSANPSDYWLYHMT
jgi:hypothetical protein